MKQQKSPNKRNSDGYVRICADCGADMHWNWGGKITYFQCEKCERIEPCCNILVKRTPSTVTIEDGNKKETFAYRPEDFERVFSALLSEH